MKRTRRTIKDDFPAGSLDRAALRQAFVELREKRLARDRRASVPAADNSRPEADCVREQAASTASDATRKQNHAA
jgi:hypothetical protein